MNPQSSRCFLNSFRPLSLSAPGRRAIAEFGLPEFIDGSCRREPDFEADFPSITATCRGNRFAPRLLVGDTVIYLTKKGPFLRAGGLGQRLVAVLKVHERCGNHVTAAEWYHSRGLRLPSNCLVVDNPPVPFERTNREPPADVRIRVNAAEEPERAIRLWDAAYKKRVDATPVFLICEAEFLDIHDPPEVSDAVLLQIFGRRPGTQNPPRIRAVECASLRRIARCD